jgi:hypothetical protein
MEFATRNIAAVSLIIILCLMKTVTITCQETTLENIGTKLKKPVNSLYETRDNSKEVRTLVKPESEVDAAKEVILYRYPVDMLRPQSKIKPEKPLDVVGSFRSNIRFGGFWEKYAIVNFTPQVFIKPFDFLSIYAQHNISYFVPMEKIRENIKGFMIEGAAIMAVETTFRFLNSQQSLVGKVLNFLAKNLIITYMTGVIRKSEENGVMDFGHYYYSASVRF